MVISSTAPALKISPAMQKPFTGSVRSLGPKSPLQYTAAPRSTIDSLKVIVISSRDIIAFSVFTPSLCISASCIGCSSEPAGEIQ